MFFYLFLCVLSLSVVSVPTQAREVRWVHNTELESGTYNWNNASNWDTGEVPQDGDDVIIRPDSGYFTILIDQSTNTVESLIYYKINQLSVRSSLEVNNELFYRR